MHTYWLAGGVPIAVSSVMTSGVGCVAGAASPKSIVVRRPPPPRTVLGGVTFGGLGFGLALAFLGSGFLGGVGLVAGGGVAG